MPLTDAALLSFDSLVAGCAVAPLVSRTSHRLAAAAAFGAADAAASLAGALLLLSHHGLLAAAPALPALYGACLVAASLLARRELRAGRRPALTVIAVLAAALSVDNLAASAAAHDPAAAIGMGLASGAFVLAGLTIGGRVLHRVPPARRTAWVGAGLATAACSAVVA